MVHDWDLGLLFMNFNLTSKSVQSILLFSLFLIISNYHIITLHIISPREDSKINGKYIYHPLKSYLTWILVLQEECVTKF
jgi:hypothetical protein